MNPDRELRLADVLERCLADLRVGNAPDRKRLLAEHADLRDELDGALDALGFVEQGNGLAGAADERPPPEVREIGDFRILKEIGRGGMGVVYEAEQLSLGRRVALKILPFAAVLDSTQLQRFKNEAQAAAHLHHTNIVPVYSVGCERGVHYYAMPYIEGQTVAALVRDLRGLRGPPGPSGPPSSGAALRAITKGRTTESPAFCRSVAELGVQVTLALDHAHQQGVVHRDIKPANLIVDMTGSVWITDFGLASFRSTTSPGLTLTGDLLGTVRYMSPEQALAKRVPIDHRTDIYSFGVTLYELLTLEAAFPGDNPQQILQEIAFREPRPPSRINRAVPPELETILVKATAKDPEARYATAKEMAEDLQRFLDDKPIQARRPSFLDRGAKWARRHRGLVAGAVALLVVLAVGSAASTILVSHARAEAEARRVAAERSLGIAREAVDEMLTKLGDEGLRDIPLLEPLRRDLLTKAVTLYEGMLGHDGTDPALRLSDATTRLKLGKVLLLLGDPERAGARLDEACERLEAAVRESRDDLSRRTALVDALVTRGWLLRAPSHPEEAESDIRRAIAEGEHVAVPASGEHMLSVARAYTALMSVLTDRKDLGDAEVAGRRALAIYDQRVRAAPGDRSALLARAVTLNNLQCLLQPLGRDAEVLTLYRGVLASLDNLARESPEDREVRWMCAVGHGNLGASAWELHHWEEAERQARLSLKLLEGLARDFPMTVKFSQRLAQCHRDLGRVLLDSGRPAEALVALDRALELAPDDCAVLCNRGNALMRLGRSEEALRAVDHAVELAPADAETQVGRGSVLAALGRREEALAAEDRAVQLDPSLASAHWNRGAALDDLGRYEEALAAYDRALELDPRNADACYNRGNTLARLHRPRDALASYDRAIGIDPNCAKAHAARGSVLADVGRDQEAFAAFDRALEIEPNLAAAHGGRGVALDRLGRHDEALAAFERALAAEPDNARIHDGRGCALAAVGRFEDALRVFDRAIELDPTLARAHMNRGNALFSLGRPKEALAALDRAIELDPNVADGYVCLGATLNDLGRAADALRAEDRAIVLDPTCAAAHHNRGAALRALGRSEDALAALDKALALDPGMVEAHSARSVVLADLGRCEEALAAADRAVALNPDFAEAHTCRGNALCDLGRLEEAVAAHNRAIELQPRLWDAYTNRGFVLARMGRLEQALADDDRAIAINANNSQAYSNRAIALARLGRYAEAVATYRTGTRIWRSARGVIAAQPADAEIQSALAWQLVIDPDPAQRDVVHASELAAKVVEHAPKDGNCWNTLGIVRFRSEDWKGAIEALGKSMELRSGGDPYDWCFLAMADWRLGKKEAARRWYDRSADWIAQRKAEDRQLHGVQVEAAKLLGIGAPGGK